MSEQDWKAIALDIQRNTRATCERECRAKTAPLIEELGEAIALLQKHQEFAYEGDLSQEIAEFLHRTSNPPKEET